MLAAMMRVIVFVGDVEKCADYFVRMFDLEVIESTLAKDEWMELDAGGCRLAFHKAYGPDGPIDEATGGPSDPHKIVFYAEDVEAVRAELVKRGAEMLEVHRFGELVLCDRVGPEGHRFQVSNRG